MKKIHTLLLLLQHPKKTLTIISKWEPEASPGQGSGPFCLPLPSPTFPARGWFDSVAPQMSPGISPVQRAVCSPHVTPWPCLSAARGYQQW